MENTSMQVLSTIQSTIHELRNEATSALTLSVDLRRLEGQLESIRNSIHNHAESLKSREEGINARISELEKKEDEFELSQKLEIQKIREKLESNVTEEKDIEPRENRLGERSSVWIHAKRLQKYLNERYDYNDLESIKKAAELILHVSSDPGKLVLDAMEGFYPPDSEQAAEAGDDNNKLHFEGNVVNYSCTFLLDQLMEISPEIKPEVKSEAKELAFQWITKMKGSMNYLEVLGFLLLLACYGLESYFDSEELCRYICDICHCYGQASQLSSRLRLTDQISGFIKNLLENKEYPKALTLITAFELADDKFPLVPVLFDYIKFSKSTFKRCKKSSRSPQARIAAAEKRIIDLRIVLHHIEANNLQPHFQHLQIQNTIKHMATHIESYQKQINPEQGSSGDEAPLQQSTAVTQYQQQAQNKRQRIYNH